MKAIGIIHNPRSKKNMKHPETLDALRDIVGRHGTVFAPLSFEELMEVVKEIKRDHYEIVCVNGGDGTNHQIITRMINIYRNDGMPLIAHLRGGTMNTISKGIDGIRGSGEGIVRKLVEHYRKDRPFRTKTTRVLNVNGRYGFIFGTGLVSNLLDVYYEGGNPGPIKALQIIYKAIASTILKTDYIDRLFSPIDAKVLIDGNKLEQDKCLVVVGATIKSVGLNFRPLYRADELPDRIHIFAGTATAMDVIKRLRKLYVGHPPDIRTLTDTLAQNVEVASDNPIKYTIDGDMYEDLRIACSSGPELRYIRG